MDWEGLDWATLRRLRARFLSEEPAAEGDYWEAERTLQDYDRTFGQRIGWKWDAVLEEIATLGWQPPAGAHLLDWGCGTGIASRRFLARWPIGECHLWDRSHSASRFAAAEVEKLGARAVVAGDARQSVVEASELILLLSHVLNELDSKTLDRLLALLPHAHSVFWVEPGTPALSRSLIEVRERLRPSFRVLAPCPHQEKCGLLAAENRRHWCHHFARPPRAIFQDGNWVRFGKEMGIDLRSLPVSYLVLTREPGPGDSGLARVIGRPRRYKGYTQALLCRARGVCDEKVTPRASPESFARLEEDAFSILLR